MTPLYLDWHLGLGDAIVCNGLVRWLARDREVWVPCHEHNYASVAHVFSDLPAVKVKVVGEILAMIQVIDARPETLSIGLNNPRWGTVQPWDCAFYELAGVPFEAKWDLFHVPESGTEIDPEQRPKPYKLVHEDRDRGFAIQGHRMGYMQGYAVGPATPRITDWRYVIRDAAEIHCIDSAVIHLAELLPTTGKLFYHRYARPAAERQHVDAVFRKDWQVID